jgi:hypothetical protein
MERSALNRPITEEEISVVLAALARVPCERAPTIDRSMIEKLRVVAKCPCGCDSVDFVAFDKSRRPRRIADGIGETPSGGVVGLLIWGDDSSVTGIEVYDLGAGQNDLRLPSPESIRAFHSAA